MNRKTSWRASLLTELAKNTRRVALIAISFSVTVPGLRADVASSANDGKKPRPSVIKIGAVVATAGPASLLGNSFLKAIQLAKEDVKNTTNQYELVVEQITSPEKAEPAIKKLIQSDKVDALIVGMSMSGSIVKPYAAAAKIPMFCICSVGSVGDDLYTFTTMPLAEDEAAEWVGAASKRGVKTVARITQNFPSIDNHVRAVKAESAKAGIEFVYDENFEATTTDFTSTIEAAKRTSPDVYFIEGFEPALSILGRQLRSAGIRNIATVVAFSVSAQPELFEGGWYMDSYVSPEFKARLDQRYRGTRLATHMMPYATIRSGCWFRLLRVVRTP